MSHDNVRATITFMQGQIAKLQGEITTYKKTINNLCTAIGDTPLYADVADEITAGTLVMRSDEFYGKPLATVVRIILERRQRANMGAASVPEIYKVMKDGGYLFEAKNEANSQRGLHIALAKNTTTFHRLPNGNYGLREWYPAIKERSKPEGSNGEPETSKVVEAGDKPLHEELQESASAVSLKDRASAKAK